MTLYLQICFIIFVINMLRGVWYMHHPSENDFGDKPFSKLEFWVWSIAWAFPFLNLLLFALSIYYYITTVSKPSGLK